MWILLTIEVVLVVLAVIGATMHSDRMTVFALQLVMLVPGVVSGWYVADIVPAHMEPAIPNMVFGADRAARENITIVTSESYGRTRLYTFSNGEKATTPTFVGICSVLGFAIGGIVPGSLIYLIILGITRQFFPATHKLLIDPKSRF